jgi:hypothetical protein
MNPLVMTLTALEATLLVLYSSDDLDEATRIHRTDLAHLYHDLTYFRVESSRPWVCSTVTSK